MRCPKCHYLSFEPEPRCKNCGYDLSFGPDDLESDAADAADRTEASEKPSTAEPPTILAVAASVPASMTPAPTPVAGDPAPAGAAASADEIGRGAARAAAATTIELPLFVQALSEPAPGALADIELHPSPPPKPEPEPDIDEEPLVKLPRAPRPPLAVRRPTPAPGRVREKYQAAADHPRQVGLLERDLLDEPPPSVWPAMTDSIPELPAEATGPAPAGAVRRIEAALVDGLFIGTINLAVIWLTLERCDLSLLQIGVLPILPIAAYLFLLDAGYLLMFTATNGQTIGKMLAGIRVVGASTDTAAPDHVPLKRALLRAVLTFPSVLVLGAGFLPALVGHRLALHDRFAHTRVVRA